MSIHSNQSGVAILYILMGVVLFAALTYTFIQSINSTNTSQLTEEEARVYAQDVLSYANRLSRGVQRVQVKGTCSENDISFYLPSNTSLSIYEHDPEVDDTCKVFHENGGAISWQVAPKDVNDGSDWLFTGNNRVRDLGLYSDGPCNEIIAFLTYMDETVCAQINIMLRNIQSGESIPNDDDDISTTPYTGEFSVADSKAIYHSDEKLVGKQTGCFKADTIDGVAVSGDVYYFYHVLIAR